MRLCPIATLNRDVAARWKRAPHDPRRFRESLLTYSRQALRLRKWRGRWWITASRRQYRKWINRQRPMSLVEADRIVNRIMARSLDKLERQQTPLMRLFE